MFTALIVEDSLFFRRSLKEMLHSRYPAIKVKEAASGAEALRIVDSGVPDLIFMGIRLPGANGLEITKKIKQGHPRATVIIVTSYDIAEYRDAARLCGADFFIPKSSSVWEEVTDLVEAVMSKAPLSIAGLDKEEE